MEMSPAQSIFLFSQRFYSVEFSEFKYYIDDEHSDLPVQKNIGRPLDEVTQRPKQI